MSLPDKPSRLDFSNIDIGALQRILKTGDLSSLTPAERSYFDMMEMVRGLNARMQLPGGDRIVTKAGIIKLLKSEAYGLSDWMARQVYADSLNFFYSDDGISARAWSNIYAEKMDKLGNIALTMGKLKEAKSYFHEAAKLRGCFDAAAPEIPEELLNAKPVVIYTADPEAMGAAPADRKKLEHFIDSLPDLPDAARKRVKEDAGINRLDLLKRLMDDQKEFADEDS